MSFDGFEVGGSLNSLFPLCCKYLFVSQPEILLLLDDVSGKHLAERFLGSDALQELFRTKFAVSI
jgi:hypothetical protein